MGLRYSAAFAALGIVAAASCAFDWDNFDPRLASVESAADSTSSMAATGGAGVGGSSASTGGTGGTHDPGDFLCAIFTSGWARDVAGYPDGGFAVVGNFHNTIDLGGGPLVSAGEDDGFVARFGPACEHVFSHRTGGPEMYEGIESVAVQPNGGVVGMGDFHLTADLGGMTATSNGPADSFIARLTPDGSFDWVKQIGGPGDGWGRSLTVDGSGNVYFAALYDGTIDLGGGLFTSAGSSDVIVAKLDGTGAHQWSMSFGSASGERARIAVDASGHAIVAGGHEATMLVDTITVPHVGSKDAYVLEIDDMGNALWAHNFSSPESTATEYAQSVAMQPNGNIVLVGRFDTTLAFGMTQLVSAGGRDVFLATLDGDGNPLWAKSIGGGGDEDRALAVAVDATGRIAVGGSFEGQVELGGGPVGDGTNEHVYVAVYDPDGALLWARVFAAPGADYTRGLGVAFVEGGVVLSGTSNAPIDFGGGAPPVASGFAVKLAD